MFLQVKPAHRRAEQSGTAHWRAPVIPTSFPAALPLWARHGAAASRPCGGTGALGYHLLAGARQGATACPGGGDSRSRLLARGSGCSRHSSHPSSDLVLTAALLCRYPCAPSRDAGSWNAMVTERRQTTRSQSETSGAYRCSYGLSRREVTFPGFMLFG